MKSRVGIGYDVHRFAGGRALVLGGVTVPHTLGLVGHSDADALTHAVMDAILGALALGDLGTHFPDSDPAYKGARSVMLLARVAAMARERGYVVGNVDATVITEVPKLAPHAQAMCAGLAAALGVDPGVVSVKAKTHEKLGSLGRGEGLAVMAVVLMERMEGA
jgi:2-C-methyl-D-erythritol 2,4-cyclodiphosphate synthase